MKNTVMIFLLTASILGCTIGHKKYKTDVVSRQWSDAENALLDKVQIDCINYMWQGGEPISGAARERYHSDQVYGFHGPEIVTTGGTGFGIMALIVGIERGFIPRNEAVKRLNKLIDWLSKADRYHGVWPHWMNPDGTTYPFSPFDDGGDLVESAFVAQSLLVLRQYLQNGTDFEQTLASKSDKLWREIEWSWHTKNGEEILYWHWSPNYGWKMNFAVKGHNECMIMYFLGVASPTFGIDPALYHNGYMKHGKAYSTTQMYDIPTILDHYDTNDIPVGPLFWAHYSFLGLDPRGLFDGKASYWEANRNHALIHYQHCKQNPYDYEGYSDKCWGLTSSYSMTGYAGHNPTEDLGVISPTAALSSFPYTPEESMGFLKFLYTEQDTLIGEFGPYDAFSFQSDWAVKRYLAIDQLPIPVMIENQRSGLIWKLFMSAPEVKNGMKKLGFIQQLKKEHD